MLNKVIKVMGFKLCALQQIMLCHTSANARRPGRPTGCIIIIMCSRYACTYFPRGLEDMYSLRSRSVIFKDLSLPQKARVSSRKRHISIEYENPSGTTLAKAEGQKRNRRAEEASTVCSPTTEDSRGGTDPKEPGKVSVV